MSLNGPLCLKGRRLMFLSDDRVAVILAGKTGPLFVNAIYRRRDRPPLFERINKEYTQHLMQYTN